MDLALSLNSTQFLSEGLRLGGRGVEYRARGRFYKEGTDSEDRNQGRWRLDQERKEMRVKHAL